MINYKQIIIFIFIVFSIKSFGQDCKTLLINYSNELNKLRHPEGNVIYFLDFLTTVKYNKKYLIEDKHFETKIVLSEKVMMYNNNIISVFKDEKDIYTIIHPQKKIIHSKSVVNDYDSLQNVIFKQQLFFLESSSGVFCKDIIIKNKKYKYIILKPNEEIKKIYNIEKLKYYYDLSEKRIYKVVILYNDKSQITEQTIIYKKMDTDYKKINPKNAKSLIFNKNMKLKDKYKTYKIIENF